MSLFLLFACGFFEGFFEKEYFSEEKQNYQQYVEAKKFLDEKDYEKAIQELEKLWQKTGSRAILENLAEVYRVSEQYEQGLSIVSNYLEKHPGDFELRLMRAKLLLGLERWEEAKGDLQIILFNKKMSLWDLVQDPDLKPYKNQPELAEILGFSTIQLRQLNHPDGGLVGDILLLDLQINHLRTCDLAMQEIPQRKEMKIKQIRLDTRKVDEWVVQTQLQINWQAIQEGTIPALSIPIFCDDDSIKLKTKPIVLEELVQRVKKPVSKNPFILLPKMEDCLPEETKASSSAVAVQFRANGLLERECKIHSD